MSTTVEMLVTRVEALEKQMTAVLSKMEIEKPKKKRGVSGYLVYAKEMRQSAKESLVENGNETPKPTEVLTQVAKMWRELSEVEKNEWNEKAKQLNPGSEDED